MVSLLWNNCFQEKRDDIAYLQFHFRDKERKKREDGLLSDDELEREFDDLSSVDDEDINEDDLMMELEEMIGDD